MQLVSLLDIEQLETNLFRGQSPQTSWQRVFGGQVIGQALVAACRTVEGRPPHSLHAYFLLPGDPSVPIIYEVDALRDGKSFSTRRVTAIQHGHPIYSMIVSFHNDEEGFQHQAVMPDVPPPEALAPDKMLHGDMLNIMPEAVRRYFERDRPLDLRPVEFQRYMGERLDEPKIHIWIRVNHTLPDDPVVHQCALAYLSDMTLLDVALVTHGRSVFCSDMLPASLDHALWFHRPFRADEWLLYAQDSPNALGGRGLTRGLLFSRDGRLVASVAQEGLIRPRRPA